MLDAVFYPQVLQNPMAFLQEGWRYEIDSKTGELSYNGVVYNEMKGCLANPEALARRELICHLYPDTNYAYYAGGKPEAIPHLTYEKLCAFYRKYYHPTNAKIFIEGKLKLAPVLEKLDSYLQAYERVEKIPSIPFQAPIEQKIHLVYPSKICNRRTILSDGWCVGSCQDLIRMMAWRILVRYLTQNEPASLKQALLSRKLCDDVILDVSLYQQVTFGILVRNTSDDQAETCRQVIRQFLIEELRHGLDHKFLNYCIINSTLRVAKRYGSVDLKGNSIFFQAMRQWQYDGDIAASFDMRGICEKLFNGVDAGMFEEMLLELLENQHHVELTISPDANCGKQQELRAKQELAQIRNEMSDEEIAALRQQLAEFSEYQKSVDSNEKKQAMKRLEKHTRVVVKPLTVEEHTIEEKDGVTCIRVKTDENDEFIELLLYFPIGHLSKEELLAMPLLTSLLGSLPTRSYSIQQLSSNGLLCIAPITTARGIFIRVNIMGNKEEVFEALSSLQEILCETSFNDIETIEKIRMEEVKHAEKSDFFSFCESYAMSFVNKKKAYDEILGGLTQLRWLRSAKNDQAWLHNCAKIASGLFLENCSVISYTNNLPEEAWKMLKVFFPKNRKKYFL